MSRAAGTPITLLSGDPALKVETNHALAFALLLGAGVGLVIGGVAPLTPYPTSVALVAVAAPAILMQDAARFACIASGRPVIAVISDGLWAAGSLTLFLLAASVTPAISPSTVVAGWSALAVLAAVVILLLARFWPDFRGTVEWLRTTTADRIRYGATMAMGGSSSVLFLFVVAALIGSSAIAALRGSASLLSPLNILFASMALVLVPEFRRGPAATPADTGERCGGWPSSCP